MPHGWFTSVVQSWSLSPSLPPPLSCFTLSFSYFLLVVNRISFLGIMISFLVCYVRWLTLQMKLVLECTSTHLLVGRTRYWSSNHFYPSMVGFSLRYFKFMHYLTDLQVRSCSDGWLDPRHIQLGKVLFKWSFTKTCMSSLELLFLLFL